jgi:ribosomal protein S1
MKKKSVIATLIIILTFSASPAKADSILLPDGEIIKGKVEYVSSSFIKIKTPEGEIKINRAAYDRQARDIVETRFFKNKKISGKIIYCDENNVEIETHAGKTNIKRFFVRNIVLSWQNTNTEE